MIQIENLKEQLEKTKRDEAQALALYHRLTGSRMILEYQIDNFEKLGLSPVQKMNHKRTERK